MSHLLNNPVWAALTSGNADLAVGNDLARYISREISPFSAIKELNLANFQELYDMVPFKEPIAIFSNEKLIYPQPWKIINRIDGFQMIYPKVPAQQVIQTAIVKLNEQHVPEMLELTKSTNPGPFLSETIKFGNYEGILSNGQLVSMAGQRLHSGNYVEISAVCTHPDHVGKGYARALIDSQIRNIVSQGEIPYLHVRGDNTRALEIYKEYGFKTRCEMIIYILSKN
ncbi:GNAT family N-acetyltransferase [Pedobacter sandarakinus]|uniref:GNAT family N-acetyltransferase n=1 Tax=Pedobacter sandarakinus TaxID=353156 RepID=UPI0022474941|nr:GNAT family N-acetyltransferase [Pedobacter sandarakinus]MCX2574052.1 GNAT family N-acetyltransferase [Pedobacter sandarakinus]